MPPLIRRRDLLIAATASPILGVARANAFPAKPLKMVVGYAPGGAADVLARILSAKAADRFGQPMVVENRPGAGGVLAADVVAKSPADGYVFYLSDDAPLSVLPGIGDPRAATLVKQLTPVVGLTTVPLVLIVGEGFAARGVGELVAQAKAKPDQLNYASAGNGNISHMAGELLKKQSGTRITHVPYRGGVPGLASVLSGETQMMFVSVSTALAQIKSGKVRALALADTKRSPALPDVPTFAEQGLQGMTALMWHGILTPAGTPAPVNAKLREGMLELARQPDVEQRLREQGFEITPRSDSEFAQWIGQETAKWRQVGKAANIKPEA